MNAIQTLQTIMLILQIQTLGGKEKCDLEELYDGNQLWHHNWELGRVVSYEFSEQVRHALLLPTLQETNQQMDSICEEFIKTEKESES